MPSPSARIDTRPLHGPVTAEERRRHDRGAAGFGIFFAVIVSGTLLLTAALLAWLVDAWWLMLIAAAVSGALILIMEATGRRAATRRIRLTRFAEHNGLAFREWAGAPDLRGIIFTVGDEGRARREFTTRTGVRLGDWEYTTGAADSRTTHRWRYLVIPLDRPVPHMILDAKGNDGLFRSSLPVQLRGSQRIDLEGDFGRVFAVYAPDGYDVDARYLLTPSTMALFMDNLQSFDIEFVDQQLVLVRKGRWEYEADHVWRFVEWVTAVLQPHVTEGTSRYRDDRVRALPDAGPAGADAGSATPAQRHHVAAGGRRLRRGSWLRWAGLVFGILYIGGAVAFAIAGR